MIALPSPPPPPPPPPPSRKTRHIWGLSRHNPRRYVMKLWSCAFQHLHTVGVARRLLANEEPPSPVARRSLKHNGSRRGCVGVFRPSWFINKTGPWISANATITTQGRVGKRRLFLLVTCYRRYFLVLTSGGTYHVIIMLLCYILCGKDIKSPFGVWGKPISVLYVTLVCRSDNKVHFHINVRLWCREVLHKAQHCQICIIKPEPSLTDRRIIYDIF